MSSTSSEPLLLCDLPTEVLEPIALELAIIEPTKLPLDVLRLGVTCRRLHHFVVNSEALWAKIYRATFDSGAAARRLGRRCFHTSNQSAQLQRNYRTLNVIRRGDIYHPDIQDVFWQILSLLLEDDGKNRTQLDAVGTEDFVSRFVLHRLHEGSETGNMWPLDNIVNSLALWIMSMMMTPEKLASETPQQRADIIRLILPFVFASCRYATAYTPINHFDIPLSIQSDHLPPSVFTAHGPYPIYREYFGVEDDFNRLNCTIHTYPPLITVAAKHLYFSRIEFFPYIGPPSLPLFRAPGFLGPTQADLDEFNAHKKAKLYERHGWDWRYKVKEGTTDVHRMLPPSTKWDHTWEAMVSCGQSWDPSLFKGPVYPFGALDGLWAGRLAVPEQYMQLVVNPDFPADFSERMLRVNHAPIYMRFQEHHCINPQQPVRTGGRGNGFDDGLFNAYLPSVHLSQRDGLLTVSDLSGFHTYETFVPGKPNSHSELTCTACAARLESEDAQRRERMNVHVPPSAEDERYFAAAGMGIPNDHGRAVDDNDMDDMYDSTCCGIEDVIITGSPDLRHCLAWGHWKYYGRVRRWDGLIAILRVPPSPQSEHNGRWIFTGYLVGGENIIGNWRYCSSDVGVPTFEGPFVMSRVLEH